MTKLAKLSDKEIELLDMMVSLVKKGERDKSRIYMLSASKLKLSGDTVRARVSRLKSKYEVLMYTIKEMRGYQQIFFQRTGGRFNPLSRRGKSK